MAAGTGEDLADDLSGKAFDRHLFRRLLAYSRPHWKGFFVSMVLLLILSALTLSVPVIIGKCVSRYLSPESASLSAADRELGLMWTALTLVALGLGVFVCRWFQMAIINRTGQQVIHDLRQSVFRHITQRDLRFFDRSPVGSLVTRVTSDIETLNEFFVSGIDVLISDVVRIVLIAILLFVIDWRMALATLLAVPLILAWAFHFQRRARKLFRHVRGQVSRLNTYMNEALTGIAVLKVFRREQAMTQGFQAINQDLARAHVATVWNFSWFFPGMEFFSSVGSAAILVVGGRLVLGGELALGDMFTCSMLLTLFIEPLRQLADKYNILQAAVASGERVFRVLDDHSEIPLPEQPHVIQPVAGDVRFEDVSFSYDTRKPVLEDISFHVQAGQNVALVGPTGSGKSTIISLLSRFYDPTRGRILLDGHHLLACDPREVRRHIGLVLQDVFLFAGTVRENLTLGDESLDDERLLAAAAVVNAEGLIASLGGLDAQIAERGATLSTGQKQLLAFARTLAHEPAVLVLDEATAHIDTISEVLIQEALQHLMEGRTSIIIAHRLSTIRHCDRILVIHHGRLREQGTHAELLRQDGVYAHLLRMQFQANDANARTPGP